MKIMLLLGSLLLFAVASLDGYVYNDTNNILFLALMAATFTLGLIYLMWFIYRCRKGKL